MTILLSFIWVAACGFVAWSLISMIWRKSDRKKLKLKALGGFLLGCLLVFAISKSANRDAEMAGFAGVSDQQRAEKAGVKDPVAWKSIQTAAVEEERKKEAEAEANARQFEAERNEREKLEAAKVALQADQEAKAAEVEAELQAAKVEDDRKAKELACRQDLQCWGEEGFPAATTYCPSVIQGLAKWDFEWTDGWTEPKFSRYRWKNQKKGIVTYIGDKLKLQNGFGAWKHVQYTCDFDPVSKTVLNVSAG